MDDFQVTEEELSSKISTYSKLELTDGNQYSAVVKMLSSEKIEMPAWCRFFIWFGMNAFRNDMVNLLKNQRRN